MADQDAYIAAMTGAPFLKMHGIGNDFVVLDARVRQLALTRSAIQAIGDRRRGVGFDQLLVLEPSPKGADVFMRIFNPDGSEAGACGNGTRCVASLILSESGKADITVETIAGILQAKAQGSLVSVAMGQPRFDPAQIPVAGIADPRQFVLSGFDHLGTATALSMGNPHVAFFVADPDAHDLAVIGPRIEHHPAFPDRVNVSIAGINPAGHIVLKVWERSAGATLACGSAACASLVAAHLRGLGPRKAQVILPGGPLTIEWAADDQVWMTGPVASSFSGLLTPELLAAA